MTETRTIKPGDADDVMWAGSSGPWTKVTEQREGSSRWYEQKTLVIRHEDGTYWGLPYEQGLTEVQETEWPWNQAGKELKLDRLYSRELVETKYTAIPPDESEPPTDEELRRGLAESLGQPDELLRRLASWTAAVDEESDDHEGTREIVEIFTAAAEAWTLDGPTQHGRVVLAVAAFGRAMALGILADGGTP